MYSRLAALEGSCGDKKGVVGVRRLQRLVEFKNEREEVK